MSDIDADIAEILMLTRHQGMSPVEAKDRIIALVQKEAHPALWAAGQEIRRKTLDDAVEHSNYSHIANEVIPEMAELLPHKSRTHAAELLTIVCRAQRKAIEALK